MTTTASPQARATLRRALRPRQLLGVLAVVLVAVLGWLFRPTAVGGDFTLVTVTGTSMQPTMHTGDLAIVHSGDSYTVGDIVAYRITRPDGTRGATVIHRIVGGSPETGFVTRGDNNDFDDPWRPVPEQITGELWAYIPDGGAVVMKLRDPLFAATTVAAITVFLVVAGDDRKGARRRRATSDEDGESR